MLRGDSTPSFNADSTILPQCWTSDIPANFWRSLHLDSKFLASGKPRGNLEHCRLFIGFWGHRYCSKYCNKSISHQRSVIHTEVQHGSSDSSDPLWTFIFIVFSCSGFKIHGKLSISSFSCLLMNLKNKLIKWKKAFENLYYNLVEELKIVK